MEDAVGRLAQRRREHADNGVRLPVQVDGTTNDVGVAPEGLGPHPIADKDDATVSACVVLGERSAERGTDSKEIQEAGFHEACAILPCFTRAGEDVGSAPEGLYIGEDAILRPPLTERLQIHVGRSARTEDRNQSFRLVEGDRTQHQRIDDGEDCCGRAHAERQCARDGHRVARPPDKAANCVA